MTELILKAIVTGLILSIMIGPVFFVLLETSIRKGVKAALYLDLGVLISDLIYILIAYFFYAKVSELAYGENEAFLKIIGGVLFIAFGVITFIRKPKEMSVEDLGKQQLSGSNYAILFIKGFLLNMVNPMVIFYWFSVMTFGVKEDSDLPFAMQMLVYIGVLLAVFFSIDLLKIIGAKKLRPFITDAVLRSINRITGAILAAFGIILAIQGIMNKM
ncbi:MAG: LysE family translocator [Bacteroidetes bacterium]|nr:MAG: LysE family translocator [Bacteroidota bacterium]